MSDLRSRTPTNHTPLGDVKTLTQWVQRLVSLKQAKVRSRLRGNSLHILIESQPCPEASAVLPPLIQGFAETSPKQFLPHGSAPIDRVVVYGRLSTQTAPAWAEAFYLNQTEPTSLAAPEAAPTATTPPPSDRRSTSVASPANAAIASPTTAPPALVSTMALARQGQPQAIARYLSHAFSHFGLAVRVRLDQAPPENPSHPASPSSHSPTSHSPTPLPRLIVICESIYSPDPLLLAEPIAQRLRALELDGFRDAIVFGQVRGEAQREWALRVDLTPPDVILKEWARWGDVQAITHLLQRMLVPQQIQASALLKDSTLHLSCRGIDDTPPDKLTTIAAIAPILESLTPQGITAASIYGLTSQGTGSSELFPLWVHWLNLPASNQPTLAKTTLELAHAGNLAALTFLLDRLLNPKLEEKLTTGGVRVQIRPKADLLHVMVDAPLCPSQAQTGSAIVRFLQPLQVAQIAGVRVYGRRAGQKQPLWSYGIDFSTRSRLVPEATPEFAASDAYVSDLLASPGGALVPRGDLPPNALQSVLGRLLSGTVQGVRRSLIRSELFIASDGSLQAPQPGDTPTEHPAQSGGIGLALVWGAIGVLLVVQSDWLLGQWLQQASGQPGTTAPSVPASPTVASSPSSASPPSPSPFSSIPLKPSTPTDKAAFNPSGFTQPGTQPVEPATQTGTLPASPLQPKGAVQAEAYPTFNSRQLDEKLQLYKQYIEQHGAPDVLIIGSSRALRGIDPIAIEMALAEQGYADVKVFNFGINGATAQVVNLIVQQMLPPDKLPKLILWSDGARAFNSGRLDMTFNGMLASAGYRTLLAGKPPIPSAAIAQVPSPATAAQAVAQATEQKGDRPESPTASHYQAINRALDQRLGALSLVHAQRDRLKTRLRDQLAAWLPKPNLAIALNNAANPTHLTDATSPAASASNSPPTVLPEGQDKMDVTGFLPLSNQFNPATYYQKYARVTGDYDSDYDGFNLDGIQTEALTALAQFTQSRDIPLVFVNLPLTNDYLDPTRKRYEETFQQRMLALATQLGFTYRDRQQSLGNQTNYFSDPSHLNRYGAYAVSQQLARDVMIPWQKAR